jgi:hypothetical protein
MEATLGISLYSYLYPKLEKKRAEQVQPGRGGLEVEGVWGEVAQFIHM